MGVESTRYARSTFWSRRRLGARTAGSCVAAMFSAASTAFRIADTLAVIAPMFAHDSSFAMPAAQTAIRVVRQCIQRVHQVPPTHVPPTFSCRSPQRSVAHFLCFAIQLRSTEDRSGLRSAEGSMPATTLRTTVRRASARPLSHLASSAALSASNAQVLRPQIPLTAAHLIRYTSVVQGDTCVASDLTPMYLACLSTTRRPART